MGAVEGRSTSIIKSYLTTRFSPTTSHKQLSSTHQLDWWRSASLRNVYWFLQSLAIATEYIKSVKAVYFHIPTFCILKVVEFSESVDVANVTVQIRRVKATVVIKVFSEVQSTRSVKHCWQSPRICSVNVSSFATSITSRTAFYKNIYCRTATWQHVSLNTISLQRRAFVEERSM